MIPVEPELSTIESDTTDSTIATSYSIPTPLKPNRVSRLIIIHEILLASLHNRYRGFDQFVLRPRYLTTMVIVLILHLLQLFLCMHN